MTSAEETQLLDRIDGGQTGGWPPFEGSPLKLSSVKGWTIYMSHDSAHDDEKGYVADRNTVWACHHETGRFRILGREIDHEFARKIGTGKV